MSAYSEQILDGLKAQILAEFGGAPANSSGVALTSGQISCYPPPETERPPGLYIWWDTIDVELDSLPYQLMVGTVSVFFGFAASSGGRATMYSQAQRVLQDLRVALDMNRQLTGRGPGAGGAWSPIRVRELRTTAAAPALGTVQGGGAAIHGAISIRVEWNEPAVPS